jgi:SAM-dependent methyltransferase
MPDYKTIYAQRGNEYEALISREDYQGNIPRAIDEIINVGGLDVLDLGAGTGRLTLLLAPRVKSMRAFDVSAEMLRVCRERLLASGLSSWQVDVADHRQLPAPDHSADLVTSGWSVSYLAVWNPEKANQESCSKHWARGVKNRPVWNTSNRCINGWMPMSSRTNGSVPIINLSRSRKPNIWCAFSLEMS